ncbi:MAG: hypothetical protein KA116_06005 [Proteobacteria bacterium]|nr:hypothetical protein [Pseudomonadota bacterium]
MKKCFLNFLLSLTLLKSSLVTGRTENEVQFFCAQSLELKEAQNFTFIQSTPEERALESRLMRRAGFNQALQLIRTYQSLIPPDGAVLEIGPFENSLVLEVPLKNPTVYWEYDFEAAIQLNKRSKGISSKTFQVDLNSLDERSWKKFKELNKMKLGLLSRAQKKFSAILISSVLNYVDMKSTLNHAFDLLEDNGLLIIANSNVGFQNHSKRPVFVMDYPVIETLWEQHSREIDILNKSSILRMPSIQITGEHYAIVKTPQASSPKIQKKNFLKILKFYFHAQNFKKTFNVNKYLSTYFQERENMISGLRKLNPDNPDREYYEDHLYDSDTHYHFIPDRALIKVGAQISDPLERAQYFDTKILFHTHSKFKNQ